MISLEMVLGGYFDMYMFAEGKLVSRLESWGRWVRVPLAALASPVGELSRAEANARRRPP